MHGPSRARRAAAILLAPLVTACSAGGEVPLEAGEFRSDGFPAGGGFIFGVVLDERTNGGLEDLPVTITPDDGLPLAQELESPVQAETRTNRRGEFDFHGLAEGSYVVFVRFDASHKGYGEVVERVEALARPFELRVFPAPLNLRFAEPRDGGTMASVDTTRLAFTPLRLADLITVTSETHPLYARVAMFGRNGANAGGGESVTLAGGPFTFQTDLDEQALREGQARVVVEDHSLADPLRLESSLGFFVAYRDPRGGPPMARDMRGQAISVVTP
jgi:hypothetical protein